MASSSVICMDCGNTNLVTNTSPCPQCGSMRLSLTITPPPATATATAIDPDVKISEYHEVLLTYANDLMNQGRYGIAIVVAHMACEMAVEQVLTAAFETKKIPELQEPVTSLFSGYNLNNERIRNIYAALTGDSTIQNEPFWRKFKKSATRRNRIMHNRYIANQQEVRKSLEAAKALIEHLKQKHNMPWN